MPGLIISIPKAATRSRAGQTTVYLVSRTTCDGGQNSTFSGEEELRGSSSEEGSVALLPVEELQSHQLHTTDQKHSTKMALKGSTSAAREQTLSLTGLDKRTAQRRPCSIFMRALVTTPPVTPPLKGDTPA